MNAFTSGQLDITILVKALNEEKHIERCLSSAITALERMPGVTGEVLLADSVSTDRTVEIAAGLGVRIVQFEHASDRGCGATLQLGYQYALGRYIYVLDGDMEMVPEFLQRAYQYLQSHPKVAGVAGRLIDTHMRTEADIKREEYYRTLGSEQVVPVLGGGGLYQREAVDQVGYLSNRWLAAYEEAELAVRLRAAGYSLVRLSDPAVHHSGHAESSLQMMRRLWRSRRIDASGMFLRGAIGQPWFGATAKILWFLGVAPAIYLVATLLAVVARSASAPLPVCLAIPLVVWAGVIGVLSWRKGSLKRTLLAVIWWHVHAVAGLRGFVRPLRDPRQPFPSRELSGHLCPQADRTEG